MVSGFPQTTPSVSVPSCMVPGSYLQGRNKGQSLQNGFFRAELAFSMKLLAPRDVYYINSFLIVTITLYFTTFVRYLLKSSWKLISKEMQANGIKIFLE